MSRSFIKKFPHWLSLSFSKWQSDNAMRLAASLAYYTAFSLAPLLLAAISVAGLIFGDKAASGQIYSQLQGALGPSVAEAIQELVKAASKPASGVWGAVLAFVLVLFAASGVFGELKDSLNIIWRQQPKEGSGIWRWVKGRFLSIGMVLGICFLLLVSLVINAGLGVAEKYGASVVPGAPLIMQVVTTLVSFGLITLLFALLFKYLPDTSVTWRDVWIGSVVTALFFTLGKTGLEIYISRAAPSSSYGAAGALALVLVWVYYSAQIFLMGAEFTAVYAAEEGSKSQSGLPVAPAPPDVSAAPVPLSSLPRPRTVPAWKDLPSVTVDTAVKQLPVFLGLEKEKKIRPLRLAGRLTGAALALATASLWNAVRKKSDTTRK